MKEAIGNSFITGLVLVILFIIMGLLVSSLSYSKAYKVKNKIVNVIEKYNGWSDKAESEVAADLAKMGYRINSEYDLCSDDEDAGEVVYGDVGGQYHYCVYRNDTPRGQFYNVTAFMHFDIPIIGDYFIIPVKGNSRIIYQNLEG